MEPFLWYLFSDYLRIWKIWLSRVRNVYGKVFDIFYDFSILRWLLLFQEQELLLINPIIIWESFFIDGSYFSESSQSSPFGGWQVVHARNSCGSTDNRKRPLQGSFSLELLLLLHRFHLSMTEVVYHFDVSCQSFFSIRFFRLYGAIFCMIAFSFFGKYERWVFPSQ